MRNSLQFERGSWTRVKQGSSFVGGTVGPDNNNFTHYEQYLLLAARLRRMCRNNRVVFLSLWRLWGWPRSWGFLHPILVEQGIVWCPTLLTFLGKTTVPDKVHSLVRRQCNECLASIQRMVVIFACHTTIFYAGRVHLRNLPFSYVVTYYVVLSIPCLKI